MALLGALLFLPQLGNHDLWNPDEPRYAQVASEMLASGEFLVPHLNGELYNQKPPLQFWSIAAFGAVRGGVDEVAARLPSALAALGTLLLIFAIGRRIFDSSVAWLAVLIFASCVRIPWQARTGQIDMQLIFWVTLAMYFFVRGHWTGQARWYPWFFVACGFGGLAKGPVGLLPPLLAVVAYLLISGQKGEIGRLRIGRGLLIWVGILCLWLLPAALSAGFDYLQYLVVDQNLGRYARPSGHHRPFYYFLTVIPAEFFPWSLFLPTALVLGLGRFRRSAGDAAWMPESDRRGFWFVLCWMVVTVIFFSLSPGKRTVYVLTMYPGMSLLVAVVLQRLAHSWSDKAWSDTAWSDTAWRDKARSDTSSSLEATESVPERPVQRPSRAWLWVPLTLLFVVFAAATFILPSSAAELPESAVLEAWTAPLVTGLLALLAIATAGALVSVWQRRAVWAPRFVAVAMMFAVGVLFWTLLPQIDPFKSPRQLVERLRVERTEGEPLAVFPRKDEAVIFYAGPPVPDIHSEEVEAYIESAPRVWLLAERDDWRKLTPTPALVEVARDADLDDGYLLLTSPPWPRITQNAAYQPE